MANMRLVAVHSNKWGARETAHRIERLGYKVKMADGTTQHMGLVESCIKVYANILPKT